MKPLRKFCRSLADPTFRSTAIQVALTVGSLLFLINHGPALFQGQMTRSRWISALLTYVVPYIVSVHGQYSHRYRQP